MIPEDPSSVPYREDGDRDIEGILENEGVRNESNELELRKDEEGEEGQEVCASPSDGAPLPNPRSNA